MESRKPYPSDVSDEEWALVAPHLTLFPLDAGQRKHSLRECVQRRALRGALWLPMGHAAQCSAAMVIGLLTFQQVASPENMASFLRACCRIVCKKGGSHRKVVCISWGVLLLT